MRKITADYICPVHTAPIEKGVIVTDDNGKILQIDERTQHDHANAIFLSSALTTHRLSSPSSRKGIGCLSGTESLHLGSGSGWIQWPTTLVILMVGSTFKKFFACARIRILYSV